MRAPSTAFITLLIAATPVPMADAQPHGRVLEVSVVPRPTDLFQWTARTTSPSGVVIAGDCVYDDGSQFGETRVFVWTPDAGATTIALPAGAPGALQNVKAVSDNGDTLLVNFMGPDGWHGWVWRQTGGWSELPKHEDALDDLTAAIDMSADGATILGWHWVERPEYCSNFANTFRPYIWTSGGGPTPISDFYSGGPCLFGNSGGPTQQVIFESSAIAAYDTQKFAGAGQEFHEEESTRRVHAKTLSGVGATAADHGLPMLAVSAELTGISANGQHAFGLVDFGTFDEVIRVSGGGGLEQLGQSQVGAEQEFDFVSNDGKIAFDSTNEEFGARYIWTESDGWQLVRDWLAEKCIDVLQFEFMFAVGAGPEARLMAGNGRNFLGEWVIWRVAPVEGLDTDGDGLLDDWEINGLDINQDGEIDLPLNLMGADPMKKDLFVEVDRMRNVPFDVAALNMVITAFENAPVMNPDHSTGINLWIDYNTIETLHRTTPIDVNWALFDTLKADHFGTPDERADTNWDAIKCAREAVFRYCIFADEFTPTPGGLASGLGETPGNDFIVAMSALYDDINSRGNVNLGDSYKTGSPYTIRQWLMAWTFMHELGHNLGLWHGGMQSQKSVNNIPQYVSVMNYSFTFFITTNLERLDLDYSHEALASINESSINELAGINSTKSKNVLSIHGVDVFNPTTQMRDFQAMEFIRLNGSQHDFNGDGAPGVVSVMVDLNRISDDAPSALTEYQGHNDWAAIQYAIGHAGDYEDLRHNSTSPTDTDIPAAVIGETFSNLPTPANVCAADINGDNEVNGADLAALLAEWGAANGQMDLNADGVTDGADLAALLAAWGSCP